MVEDAELFDPKDVKVETMRSRGAGGQVHVSSIPLITSLKGTDERLSENLYST